MENYENYSIAELKKLHEKLTAEILSRENVGATEIRGLAFKLLEICDDYGVDICFEDINGKLRNINGYRLDCDINALIFQ